MKTEKLYPFLLDAAGAWTERKDARNVRMMTGKENAEGNDGKIFEGMMAVDGESGKYPEFKGNVATVYTHPLSMGGSSNAHYGNNSKTYMNMGRGMGEAMVKLLKK